MAGREVLVEADKVTKVYSPRRGLLGRRFKVAAITDVSLSLGRGETLGVVGETGSGKTTLGRLIAGLEVPSSGEVRVGGVSRGHLSRGQVKAARRLVQVVFQDPYESLNPYMTVRELVEEPFRIHGLYDDVATPARIAQLLRQVGLPISATVRTPSEFSGGQQQRIAIARALALGPEVLVADEPTSALDVSIQAQILNLLLDLQAETGMAMLLISHNLLVVRHISQRMAVMYAGRVIEVGPSEDVYRHPRHPYTYALLSAIPIASPKRERQRKRINIAGEAPDLGRLPSGCAFHPRCWMATERCMTERPSLRYVGPHGHQAACHFAEDLGEKI